MAVIKSYDKLVNVLDYVKGHPHVKLQMIADDLGMSKSTLHRIVTELVDYSFLSRDEKNLTYKLGTRLLEYGNSVIENFDIRSESSDIISELNRVTLETVHLAVMVDKRVVYVDKRESRHLIRMYSLVGKEAPIHCTGVGKAILAFQTHEVIDNILKEQPFIRYTEYTLSNTAELREELATIRKEGVAFDREEHEKGIICIAAPILNHSGQVLASVSVTSITQRMSVQQLYSFKEVLVSAADAISVKLGCRCAEAV